MSSELAVVPSERTKRCLYCPTRPSDDYSFLDWAEFVDLEELEAFIKWCEGRKRWLRPRCVITRRLLSPAVWCVSTVLRNLYLDNLRDLFTDVAVWVVHYGDPPLDPSNRTIEVDETWGVYAYYDSEHYTISDRYLRLAAHNGYFFQTMLRD